MCFSLIPWTCTTPRHLLRHQFGYKLFIWEVIPGSPDGEWGITTESEEVNEKYINEWVTAVGN